VNLLGDNIDTINNNTKYILVSRDQSAGQNREITIGNRSFENVSQFKYLGTTVTYQNFIQEEIKRRLNSGNACYHSVQNLLSSRSYIHPTRMLRNHAAICKFVFWGRSLTKCSERQPLTMILRAECSTQMEFLKIKLHSLLTLTLYE
jgi:hypothetical protein